MMESRSCERIYLRSEKAEHRALSSLLECLRRTAGTSCWMRQSWLTNLATPQRVGRPTPCWMTLTSFGIVSSAASPFMYRTHMSSVSAMGELREAESRARSTVCSSTIQLE